MLPQLYNVHKRQEDKMPLMLLCYFKQLICRLKFILYKNIHDPYSVFKHSVMLQTQFPVHFIGICMFIVYDFHMNNRLINNYELEGRMHDLKNCYK